jgi:hypothetical protein
LLRDRLRRPRDLGIEPLCLVCLSGPAAEQVFCGPITDGADQVDIEMAGGYLRECYSDGQIEQQFARMRTAAERLVRTPSVAAVDRDRRCTHAAGSMTYLNASTRDRFLIVAPTSKMRCWSAHTICEARRQRPAPDYFALA